METQRRSKNKASRKKVWFNFHIRNEDENIAKGSPPFRKNWRSMQNLKYLKNKEKRAKLEAALLPLSESLAG